MSVLELLAQDDLQGAEEVAEAALRQSRELQDAAAEATTLEALVAVRARQNRLNEALRCAQDAAEILATLKDQGELRLRLLAAQLALRQGQAATAVACATAAKDLSSKIEDQVMVLQTLSAAYLANGAPKQALECASAGRELCTEGELLRDEALCLLRTAGAQVKLGDWEAAISAASDAQELFREVGDELAEAGAAGLLARMQRERQDVSAARLAAETARALLRQTGELGREVGALLLAGQLGTLELAAAKDSNDKGRNKVLAKAKEAVSLSKRLGSENLEAIAGLAQARAKVSNGLLSEAMQETKDLLPILSQCGDRRAEGSARLLQANISVLLGAPDVSAAKEALECLRGDPHAAALAQSFINRLSTRAPAPRTAPEAPAVQNEITQPATTAKPATIDKMTLALPERVKYTLTELVAEATNIEGMEEDRALMETGMTSIASIMLRDRIQNEFPEIPEMDLTFVFDYPTIRDMTGFILTQLPDA